MKKVISFLLISSLVTSVILGTAGCGSTEGPIPETSEIPQVSEEPASSYPSSSSESISSEYSSAPVSTSLSLVKDQLTNIVYDKKFACRIPRIEGGEGNPIIEEINTRLSEYREKFENAYNNDKSGAWIVIEDVSSQNDRYINIVTTYNAYPAGYEPGYAEVQDFINYVYDIGADRLLSTDEIMSSHDLTYDYLKENFRHFMNTVPELKHCEIDHFDIIGAGMDEDGSCSVYIDLAYHNSEREDPMETGTYYTYHSDLYAFNWGVHRFA